MPWDEITMDGQAPPTHRNPSSLAAQSPRVPEFPAVSRFPLCRKGFRDLPQKRPEALSDLGARRGRMDVCGNQVCKPSSLCHSGVVKRLAVIGLAVCAVAVAAVVGGWAYRNQVWLRDDYSAGYQYGTTLEKTARSACVETAEDHSASAGPQVAFAGGCSDARRGKPARPEAVGTFVQDANGLWGPLD